MQAVKFETTVDDIVAGAMPELRPMIGRRVEVIALDSTTPEPPDSLTLDDFLARRLKRPVGIEPVSLEDMERAIARGAVGGDDL